VHGIFGDPIKSWGYLPQRLLENAELDADVLSFGYPTKIWNATSIGAAATELLEYLKSELPETKHFLLFGHSTGGLIIKEMVRKDAARNLYGADVEGDFNRSVTLRMRRIVNIAVPHMGGNRFLTFVSHWVYNSLYAASCLWVMEKLFSGRHYLGRNQIISELRWHNPYLFELENDYNAIVTKLRKDHIPCPVSDEILGSTDSTIYDFYEGLEKEDKKSGIVVRSDMNKTVVRGTHKTVKLSKRKDGRDQIVRVLATIIKGYDALVLEPMVDRPLEECYSRGSNILRLTGEEYSSIKQTTDKDTELQPKTLRLGSQNQITKTLKSILDRPPGVESESVRIVVTGAAGVGKSTLLRIFAQDLAAAFFNQASPRTFLPMLFHTQNWRPTVATSETTDPDGHLVDAFILSMASDWAELTFPVECGTDTKDRFLDRLKHGQIVLVLDSIDEFLANNPIYRLVHIRQILDFIDMRAKNSSLRIIVGIRNSVRKIENLATEESNVLEIGPLSVQEARMFFGGVDTWLAKLIGQGLRNLFLTPLILTALSESDATPKTYLNRPTNLLGLALRAILHKGKLDRVRDGQDRPTSNEQWVAALSIVAAMFQFSLFHSVSHNVLKQTVQNMARRWGAHLENNFDGEVAEEFMRGFELIEDHRTCTILLDRTIFLPAPGSTYQFAHREWRDYLTACYLATSIEYLNVDELGHAAFNVPMYQAAGELLSAEALGERVVRNALNRSLETNNQYIVGNLGALIGNSIAPITGPAIEVLLGGLPKMPPLTQVVTIGSPGRRSLEISDHSAADFRAALDPVLRDLVAAAPDGRVNAIVASLSWCFLKAYYVRFGGPKPPPRLSPFRLEGKMLEDALAITCKKSGESWTHGNLEASVQLTFLGIQYTVLSDPITRPISVVHYLLCIVAARLQRAQIPEVTDELGQILEPASGFERLYREFTDVPEVYTLYKECQKAFLDLGGSLTPMN